MKQERLCKRLFDYMAACERADGRVGSGYRTGGGQFEAMSTTSANANKTHDDGNGDGGPSSAVVKRGALCLQRQSGQATLLLLLLVVWSPVVAGCCFA